jgi:acyl-CoA synthetase (AMP-forming)/AMP-acid ligase II
VVPVADDTWGQVPLAVVVGEADPEALERYARDHLADFAVPREFRFVESLPETGAGKLDREALREEHT